jgi:hypothetical protein
VGGEILEMRFLAVAAGNHIGLLVNENRDLSHDVSLP